jgi:hypothetical protein
MTNILDDLQAPAGGPTLKFENVGDKHQIVIADHKRVQLTDFTTNEPLTFKDGSPRWQHIFTSTEGERLFVKSYAVDALKKALAASDWNGEPLTGGTLIMKFTEIGEDRGHRFVAKFTPAPKSAVTIDDLL